MVNNSDGNLQASRFGVIIGETFDRNEVNIKKRFMVVFLLN